MKLSKQEADLYFELMWSLQFFVNQKLGLVSDVPTVSSYRDLSREDKMTVREALYEKPRLIDEYVAKNPDQLSAEKLAIIRKWKEFVRGDFYIERYLKKYTVFIGGGTVYGVLGLYEGLEEIIPKRNLPIYVRAVLLPFQGKMIYDGLLQTYSVFFGQNIQAELKGQYMRAKQRGEIVSGVEAGGKEKRAIAFKDWRPEIEALVREAKKLHGGAGQPAICSPAFSLVKASLDLALVGVTESENVDELVWALRKVERALGRVQDTIDWM